ncbi:MAG: IS5 family transposase [Bacteroidetes bacterium]|nr:IS5 family transposase [Bacteroidota bacterium]
MRSNSPNQDQQSFLYQGLKELLNPKDPLYHLSEKIPWEAIEKSFSKYYVDFGRPAKPIRLMVSLLLLKQMYNLGDETVLEQLVHNPYWQYFSGEKDFQWKMPLEPSDFVHFRKRIGEEGVKKILEISIKLHGNEAMETEVVIDTAVQEKNITFPTDAKLHKKIIEQCRKIAGEEGIVQRQSYKRTVKKLIMMQRFRNHPKNKKKANAASRKLKTIAGRLVRELERKLTEEQKQKYEGKLEIFNRILRQKKNDKEKVYSIHEPEVYCISKGKEHKKYESGSKASIVITKRSGIIVGVYSLEKNEYDGHTLPKALDQCEELRGQRPRVAIADRGYRGKTRIGETEIPIPKPPKKGTSEYEMKKARARFRRRAAIEPIIGHLKTDYRLERNFLKGVIGDSINLMLAVAAFNLKKWMRKMKNYFGFFFKSLQKYIFGFIESYFQTQNLKITF